MVKSASDPCCLIVTATKFRLSDNSLVPRPIPSFSMLHDENFPLFCMQHCKGSRDEAKVIIDSVLCLRR